MGDEGMLDHHPCFPGTIPAGGGLGSEVSDSVVESLCLKIFEKPNAPVEGACSASPDVVDKATDEAELPFCWEKQSQSSHPGW